MRQGNVARPTRFRGFAAKSELLTRFAEGKNVLHLGAVGCTLESTEAKIAAATRSVHALLTRVSTCVGVDIDRGTVEALTGAGLFNNLIAADVEVLSRDRIPLPTIELIVAGDVIEHLSNPGRMLESMRLLSDSGTKLLITTPNAMGLPNFIRYSLGRFRESPDHVCAFNHFSLAHLLARHGWILEELYTCHQTGAAGRTAPMLFWAGNRLFRRLPRFGGTLLALARQSESEAHAD